MKIIIIASVSSNLVIGREGQLPWKIPEDLEHFKKTTMGHSLLMGRKTFESIGTALPGRTNIVISKSWFHAPEASDILFVLDSPEKGVEAARSAGAAKLFICGGSTIYKQFIGIADEMLITEIDKFVDGDAFFPVINMNNWIRSETGLIGKLKLVRYVRSSHKNLLS